MKGILFNTKYGPESAVFDGRKTRTWRADKQPRYVVGEIVAIKQCYKDVSDYFRKKNNSRYLDYIAFYSDKIQQNEIDEEELKIYAI